MPKTTKNLPQIIRAHEGVPLELWLDNDHWRLSRKGTTGEHQVLAEADEAFANPLHGEYRYGEGILRALCGMHRITVRWE